MTLTTHATIGAVIGASLHDPFLGFTLGFISHFVVDMIPHGDRDMYEGHKNNTAAKRAKAFVTIDAIMAIIVVSLMLGFSGERFAGAMAAAIIGSVLPDLLAGVYEAIEPKWLKRFHAIHLKIHNLISDRTGDVKLRYGVAGQAVAVVLMQYLF